MGIIKIGIGCIIGIGCALFLFKLFLPADPDEPTWPEQLLLQRQAFEEQKIESEWQARVDQAGQNETQLEAVALDAIAAGHYLAAYKAGALLKESAKKNSVMDALFSAGISRCDSLGWAMSAIQFINSAKKNDMETALLNKWNACQANQK